jgi:hypothetical protein
MTSLKEMSKNGGHLERVQDHKGKAMSHMYSHWIHTHTHTHTQNQSDLPACLLNTSQGKSGNITHLQLCRILKNKKSTKNFSHHDYNSAWAETRKNEEETLGHFFHLFALHTNTHFWSSWGSEWRAIDRSSDYLVTGMKWVKGLYINKELLCQLFLFEGCDQCWAILWWKISRWLLLMGIHKEPFMSRWSFYYWY